MKDIDSDLFEGVKNNLQKSGTSPDEYLDEVQGEMKDTDVSMVFRDLRLKRKNKEKVKKIFHP